MFIGWHIVLENLTKKMLLMPIEPWEGLKLVMILMKACSKLCNKPWEGMFSFFMFSISCHFVLNVGFFPLRLVLFELPSPVTSGTMVTVEDLKQELSKYLLVCVWQKLFLPTYFTIQLIFATIHRFHCTFWYYSWVLLYYFS